MVYAYCVVPPAGAVPAPGLRGVDETSIHVLPIVPGVADAWVSAVQGMPLAADRARRVELARAHHRVVSAALAGGITPIPLRAGQVFADEDECRSRLADRAHELKDTLERFAGLVEMTATCELDGVAPTPRPEAVPDADVDAGPGLRHLRALKAREQVASLVRAAALDVAREISSVVADLARLEAIRAHAHPRVGVAVSHLVARAHVGEYDRRLTGYRAGTHGAVVVSGPAAPYSFMVSEKRQDG